MATQLATVQAPIAPMKVRLTIGHRLVKSAHAPHSAKPMTAPLIRRVVFNVTVLSVLA